MALLTSEQVADLLETKEFTVNRLARENIIPSTKDGKNYMFELKDVTAYREMAKKLQKR